MSSFRFSRLGFLPSRFTSRHRYLYSPFVPALLLAGVLSFAMFAMSGEILYTKGRKAASGTQALFLINQGAILFPFQYRNRETNAILMASSQGIPAIQALSTLNEVLETDPYAPYLLYLKVVQLVRVKDIDGARVAFARLERVAPGWQMTRNAAKVLGE